MEATVVSVKQALALVKVVARCPYCSCVNKHGHNKRGTFYRCCDVCGKEYVVKL